MGKIPKSAKKVFSGIIFDVYQWKQEMFDGTYKTFEMLKRPDTVNIIMVNEHGKILLAREQQPGKRETLGGFGGRVDQGEDILSAGKRELLEETGYVADKFELWFQISPSEKIEWTIYIYIAKGLKQTNQKNLESGEKIDIYEVTFEEFVNKTIYLANFRDQELALQVMKMKKNIKNFNTLKKLFSN